MNSDISKEAVLTDFGLLCRSYRIRQGMTIAEQAAAMAVAPSRIAKIETNTAHVPAKYVRKFVTSLNLDLLDHQQLIRLSLRPQKTEKVFEGSIEKSRAARRALNELPTWSIATNQKNISAIFGGQDPKKHNNTYELPQDLLTVERTFEAIERAIRSLFRRVGATYGQEIDILKFVECYFSRIYPHFALLPVTKASLPDRNIAITRFKEGFFIKVREDIYINASESDARARYVIAHEFAHMMLHRALPKSLMDGKQERMLLCNLENHSVELQADRGAICLLAPRNMCAGTRDALEIQRICNIPAELAKLAAREYGISQKSPQPYERIHQEIERNDANGLIGSALTFGNSKNL